MEFVSINVFIYPSLPCLTVVISTNCWDSSSSICYHESSNCSPASPPSTGKFLPKFEILNLFYSLRNIEHDAPVNDCVFLNSVLHCSPLGSPKFVFQYTRRRSRAFNLAGSAAYRQCSLANSTIKHCHEQHLPICSVSFVFHGIRRWLHYQISKDRPEVKLPW